MILKQTNVFILVYELIFNKYDKISIDTQLNIPHIFIAITSNIRTVELSDT